MIAQLKANIAEPGLITNMRETFVNWNEASLKALITMSVTSGRNYGDEDKILEEFRLLKDRVPGGNWKSCTHKGKRMNKVRHTGEYYTDEAMWLQVFTKPVFYKGCENILHLAICLFVKAPLEAIVESIGSVINRHGSKARAKMKTEHLANEIFVSWNGPQEFSKKANELIRSSLFKYFHPKPIYFYTEKGDFNIGSSTVANILRKRSRIDLK